MSSLSADLFTEAQPRATRTSCRAITDSVLPQSLAAIRSRLPKKLVELTELVEASQGRAPGGTGEIFQEEFDVSWGKLGGPAPEVVSSAKLNGVNGHANGVNGNGHTNGINGHANGHSAPNQNVSLFRAPQHNMDLWGILLPQIKEIVEMFDLVQIYLLLKTPAAEEGNNTGVEVQQQCIKVLLDARRYVIQCQGYPKLYHVQRAKLASKCLKYPQLEDYQRALAERDAEESRDCRYLLTRLRVQILAVIDILHKNFGRVDEPKGASIAGTNMY